MAILPDVTVTIQDGALGLVGTASDQAHAVIGVCSEGTANTVYSFSDIGALTDALGIGPAVEAAAHSLAIAGGPVYVVPIATTTSGATGSVTFTGTGANGVSFPSKTTVVSAGTTPPAVTLTGTPSGVYNIRVEITTGGSVGAAVFRYSLDGGATYAGTGITTASTYLMTGTGVTLNFAAGTYATDNVYTAATSLPWDNYDVIVEIVTGGALGTMQYRYALDANNPGGPSWSSTLNTVSTQRYYIIGDTGLAITFAAGTYVAGDTWEASCTPPGYTATEVNAAYAALAADTREWGFVHLVGQASSVAGSATIASAMDTLLAASATSYRYAFGLVECADDTDNNIIAAFASFASTRVSVAAGFAYVSSQLTGRVHKRSSAWPVAARLSKVTISTDAGRVIDGSLPGVTQLLRDEQVTTALDQVGFCTLRSIVGRTGYYITQGRVMAAAGSDYRYIVYRRVMDRAAKEARDALLNYLNASVRVNANGTILEAEARIIEATVNARLNAVLTQPGYASSTSCVVNRTNNVLSTQELKVQVRVRPLGYARNIALDIGFANPALAVTQLHNRKGVSNHGGTSLSIG